MTFETNGLCVHATAICSIHCRGWLVTHEVQTNDTSSFKNWWLCLYKKAVNSDETSGRDIQEKQEISFKISTYKQLISGMVHLEK